MRLGDHLKPECVKVQLDVAGKQQAVFELADLLTRESGLSSRAQEIKDAIWKRETTQSTGIGLGIAVPHGRLSGLDTLLLAVGLVRPGIDYKAIDGKPVDLILLVISPEHQANMHIQVLAAISRMLTDEPIREQIKAAKDADELIGIIKAYESR